MATVVLTLGDEGAVLAAAEGCWHAAAPPVETASAVASGDSSPRRARGGARLRVATCPKHSPGGSPPAPPTPWPDGGARFSREQFESGPRASRATGGSVARSARTRSVG